MRRKKKVPREPGKKLCRTCGDRLRCHYCGYYFDRRGSADNFSFRNPSIRHFICYSCAE